MWGSGVSSPAKTIEKATWKKPLESTRELEMMILATFGLFFSRVDPRFITPRQNVVLENPDQHNAYARDPKSTSGARVPRSIGMHVRRPCVAHTVAHEDPPNHTICTDL